MKKAKEEDQMTPEEKRMTAIFDALDKIRAEHNIKELVFIFRMDGTEEPYSYHLNENNNHHYDAARLMAKAIRFMKGKIVTELDC